LIERFEKISPHMIVPTSDLFKLAYDKHAIGAYNINHLEQILGRLAQNAVHAAMAGKTATAIGCWHGHYVHVPISLAVSARKKVVPKRDLWHSVIEATGQSPKFN